MRRHLLDGSEDVAQVSVAIAAPHRRPDGQQHDIGARHRLGQTAREAQAAGCNMPPYQVLEARLVDGYLATPQRIEPVRVLIDALDGPAEFCEACRRHQANVAGTNHANLHARIPLSALTPAKTRLSRSPEVRCLGHLCARDLPRNMGRNGTEERASGRTKKLDQGQLSASLDIVLLEVRLAFVICQASSHLSGCPSTPCNTMLSNRRGDKCAKRATALSFSGETKDTAIARRAAQAFHARVEVARLHADDVVTNEPSTFACAVIGVLQATLPLERCPARVIVYGR